MSDNDDSSTPRPRTKVRKIANSKVPNPAGKSPADRARRTQIRRVDKKNVEHSDASDSAGGDSHSTRTHSSDKRQPLPDRSEGFRRSGPQQVREEPRRNPHRTRVDARPQRQSLPETDGLNGRRLLDEASSLLALGGYLKSSDRPSDLEQLRTEIIDAVNRYRDNIADYYGVQTVEDASFCVCAFLDDCVLGSIWSKGTQWAQGSILAKIHGRADRSDLLGSLRQNLERGSDPDLLALYHTVLCLGFTGSEDNAAELSKLRQSVYQELKRSGHEEQNELITADRVVAESGERIADRLPWWTLLAAASAIMLAVFFGIQQLQKPDLNAFNVQVDQIINAHQRLALVDFVPEAYVPPPPKVNLPVILSDDIADNSVVLIKAEPGTRIVIRSDGMFNRSSSTVSEKYVSLIARIGAALDTTSGPVRVEGHTDNVPFRSAVRTNQSLSTERAQAVSQLLANTLRSDSRLLVRGRADRAPLVCNSTLANQAINRRVEIVLPDVETREANNPQPPPVCATPGE